MNMFRNVDLDRPLCEGDVFKQNRNKLGYNKRYFVLYPGFILYYNSKSVYRNDLRMKKMRHHKMLNLNRVYLTKAEGLPSNIKHAFVMHLPDPLNVRDEITLVLKTQEEKRVWMDWIQAQNPRLARGDGRR